MTDITDLIRTDHDTMRDAFTALQAAADNVARQQIWSELAELLDLHAAAEEQVFYPHLLKQGANAEDETEDAIGDHNDIRDSVAAAADHPVGSPDWWQAVRAAQAANDDHMEEEETGPLLDFTGHSTDSFRHDLGAQFVQYKTQHPHGDGADESDKDPEKYIAENT